MFAQPGKLWASHQMSLLSNLKDLAVSQSGTYAWHAIGTLTDGQIPLQLPAMYWFDLGPNFGGDGSLDHVYGGKLRDDFDRRSC